MTNNIQYGFEIVLFLGVFAAMMFFILFLGKEEKIKKSEQQIIVGKCVEFFLDENKRVRGRVCMQRGDEVTACWINRRGETKYTLLSSHDILCVTDL